jgi:hypothetical protein
VAAFLKGCKNSLGKPAKPKLAISKQILRKILDETTDLSTSFKKPVHHWREGVFELAAFCGMCRFSDLIRLKWTDIEITDEVVTLSFFTRKNDSVHAGHKVQLFYAGGRYCPVMLFRRYKQRLNRASLGGIYPQTGFFLPAIERRRGEFIPVAVKAVSRDGMRSVQKKVMSSLGIDFRLYGLHSGKNGGASHAASVKRHSLAERTNFGGWSKNSLMADHYDQTLMERARKEIGATLRL